MSHERQFLSEIERYGEQVCVMRDIFERIPPGDCNRCSLLRFCEKPRSDSDIAKLLERAERNAYREQFFADMEEQEYYD